MSDKITVKESKSIISLSTGVFLVFLILKLLETGQVANWSWWWVTSPLWIPLVFIIIIMIVVIIAAIILGSISAVMDKTHSKRLARKLNRSKFQDKLEEIAKKHKDNQNK